MVKQEANPLKNLDLADAPAIRLWALVLWPACLAACLLEALVFSMVDPAEIHWLGHRLQATRQAIYTAAFFCFWLVAILCSSLVLWLHTPANAVNDTSAD